MKEALRELIKLENDVLEVTDNINIKGTVLLKNDRIFQIPMKLVSLGLQYNFGATSASSIDEKDPLRLRSILLLDQITRLSYYAIYYDNIYFNHEAECILSNILLDSSETFENTEFEIVEFLASVMSHEEMILNKDENNLKIRDDIINSDNFHNCSYYSTVERLKSIQPNLFKDIDYSWMIQ